LNDIACNLDRTWNFTEFKFIWVGLRFNGIESKFLNWIQTHWIEFEFQFQFNSIQFNNWIKIQLKRKEMQFGGEDNENLLVNMVQRKKKL